MKTPKAIYKIFDNKTGEYIKRSKDKEVWFSETWALSAGWDHACGQGRGVREAIEQYCILNLEIHTFPIEDAIVETWAARVEKNKAASEAKKAEDALKLENSKQRKKLEQIKALESQIASIKSELGI
jgi:hypothetical protein